MTKPSQIESHSIIPDQQEDSTQYSEIAVKRESPGAAVVPWFLKVFGIRFCYLLLPFPVFFYYLFGGDRRQGIVDFYKRLYPEDRTKNLLRAFSNYYYFGMTLIDRLMPASFWDPEKDFDKNNSAKKLFHAGSFFICTHFGDWFCAALALARQDSVRVSLVVDLKQTPKFQELTKKIGEDHIQFIDSSCPTVQFVLKIKKEVESGGCIAFMGDRCFEGQNSIRQKFLGAFAEFPVSLFYFAVLLKCPIYSFVSVKTGITSTSKFRIFHEKLFDGVEKVEEKDLAGRYVGKLETLVAKYPQQWFNFYNFWKEKENAPMAKKQ